MESELIKIEKLTGYENWCVWKFQIKILLNASDLLDIVTKEVPVNDGDDAQKQLFAEWKKQDKKAQKFIATTVSKQPLLHIMNCTTAAAMWTKLESVYEQRSQTNIHMLQQKFYSVTKDSNDDIATHISKIETIAQQIKDAGDTISTTMIITKILMTLPASLSHFVTAWESTEKSEKTLENLTSRLIMEESRLSLSSQTQIQENTNAFVARKGTRYGFQKQKCNNGNNNTQKPGKCFICKKQGHWKKDCPSRKKHNESQVQGDAFICAAKVSNQVSNGTYYDDWFLDSGASDHMTFRRDWYVNYERFDKPQTVRVGNGDIIHAIGRGDINILAFNNSEWFPKHLSKVLHVPDIQVNLFSSSAALDKNLKLVSDKNHCELLKDGDVVAVGVRENSLFKMMFKTNVTSVINIATACESIDVWHKRLAHQNVNHVRIILKSKGIEYQDNPDNFCEACVYGKQHRLSFGNSDSKSNYPGELVHVDLCGPMQESSIGGSRYFILFKDDYSCFRVVYFLKDKTDVFDCFVKYKNKIKTETGHDLEMIRTDNGLEFTNKELKTMLQNNYIRHQTTVPYSPQQNGRAERDMRTIVEAARTMIYDKNLTLKLWAEAVNTAVYVLNVSAPTKLKKKSPAELWYKRVPDVNLKSIKVFGTDCYTHIPKEKRRKWDAKSIKGVFVGYSEDVKGYRVWIPTSNKVVVSRDVVFNESESKAVLQLECNKIGAIKKEERRENDSQYVFLEFEDQNKIKDVSSEPDKYKEDLEVDKETQQSSSRYNLRDRNRDKHDLMTVINEGYAFISQLYEPTCYEDARKSRDAMKWEEAMKEELLAFKRNETWDLVTLPKDKKAIDNKWIYKIKNCEDGSGQRFKARLVIRGFAQQQGVDYNETFSPVAKFSSIRLILSLAAVRGYKLRQFDIKTAFLNGDLQDEIYMKQPQGFEDGTNMVCRLRKSLYGLKQASRCWNEKFTKFLISFRLKASQADPCVFIGENLILALYIDDGLVAADSYDSIQALIDYLKDKFEIKVFGAKLFLGLEITKDEHGSFHLCQSDYTEKILSRFKMKDAKTVSTPADSTIYTNICETEMKTNSNFPFREMVGSLMYLAVGTRPDISFAVGVISRFLDKPTTFHISAAKRILRYLKGTKDFGITFSNSTNININFYSDADYAGDPLSRRSTTGHACLIGNSLISWASKQQKSVALSTTEAEYMAAASAITDMIWIKRLFEEIESSNETQLFLNMDNQSAIRLIKNPEFHKRTKHIEVKYHFIREKYTEGLFKLQYVTSSDQVADMLTKPLPKEKFQKLRSMIGLNPQGT